MPRWIYVATSKTRFDLFGIFCKYANRIKLVALIVSVSFLSLRFAQWSWRLLNCIARRYRHRPNNINIYKYIYGTAYSLCIFYVHIQQIMWWITHDSRWKEFLNYSRLHAICRMLGAMQWYIYRPMNKAMTTTRPTSVFFPFLTSRTRSRSSFSIEWLVGSHCFRPTDNELIHLSIKRRILFDLAADNVCNQVRFIGPMMSHFYSACSVMEVVSLLEELHPQGDWIVIVCCIAPLIHSRIDGNVTGTLWSRHLHCSRLAFAWSWLQCSTMHLLQLCPPTVIPIELLLESWLLLCRNRSYAIWKSK